MALDDQTHALQAMSEVLRAQALFESSGFQSRIKRLRDIQGSHQEEFQFLPKTQRVLSSVTVQDLGEAKRSIERIWGIFLLAWIMGRYPEWQTIEAFEHRRLPDETEDPVWIIAYVGEGRIPRFTILERKERYAGHTFTAYYRQNWVTGEITRIEHEKLFTEEFTL